MFRRHVRFLHDEANGPMHLYLSLIKNGRLRHDAHQEKTVQLLHDLHEKLLLHPEPPQTKISYQMSDIKEKNQLSQIQSPDFAWIQGEKTFLRQAVDWLSSRKTNASSISNLPRVGLKGLYMYGSVGTGKTMLMDLFYNSSPIKRKNRIHFHAFMQEIHKRVHILRVKDKITSDPIPLIASELANNAWLLCFDEFQVTDITDAMILRRLFSELFTKGVIMVTTSNRAPDELYSNGIQRKSFLPTIELFKHMCNVHSLDSRVDYRRQKKEELKVYFDTSEKSNQILSEIFKIIACGSTIQERKIPVWGRNLIIKEYVNDTAKISFHDLCVHPHSAADYLALASNIKILILTDIPKMKLDHRNEARRFITLIDALYENKVKLLISASAPVTELLSGEIRNQIDLDDSQRMLMDDLKLSSKHLKSSIFTGEEEIFAFQRAISRLIEMQSLDWIGTDLKYVIEKAIKENS